MNNSALAKSPFAEGVEVCYITKDAESEVEDKVKSIAPIKKVGTK